MIEKHFNKFVTSLQSDSEITLNVCFGKDLKKLMQKQDKFSSQDKYEELISLFDSVLKQLEESWQPKKEPKKKKTEKEEEKEEEEKEEKKEKKKKKNKNFFSVKSLIE